MLTNNTFCWKFNLKTLIKRYHITIYIEDYKNITLFKIVPAFSYICINNYKLSIEITVQMYISAA